MQKMVRRIVLAQSVKNYKPMGIWQIEWDKNLDYNPKNLLFF